MITKELREQIHSESLRACGSGIKGQAFELGAEWMYNHFPRINDLARQSYNTAILRGKTTKDPLHDETFWGIFEELKEYRAASEYTKSHHLPQYTEAQEELTDILICCLTELHSRGTDIEAILTEKINLNKTRI